MRKLVIVAVACQLLGCTPTTKKYSMAVPEYDAKEWLKTALEYDRK